MQSIEIDFDVYKALTSRRENESTTYNDVLRELLQLQPRSKAPDQTNAIGDDLSWVCKGTTFPGGTEFRATYKGKTYQARVERGQLVLDGKSFLSPSAAAIHVTNNPVNGWRFWECRLPGGTRWQSISTLRDP